MEPSTKTKRTMKVSPAKALFIALPLLLLIGTFSALLYLDSSAGQQRLVKWANARLSTSNSTVNLGPIEGSIFSRFSFATITVSDPNGAWLELEQAQVTWSPFALLRRNLTISSMCVASAQLHRLPQKDTTDDIAPLESWSAPSSPVDITIKAFDIAAIQVAKGLVGTRATFKSNGAIQLTDEAGILIQAQLINDGKTEEEISLDLTYPKNQDTLTAAIHINAPKGGFFGALIGISSEYAIQAQLEGSGPTNDWAGQFTATIDTTKIADASLTVKNKTLSISAKLDAADFIPDTGNALFGKKATLALLVEPAATADIADFSLNLSADTVTLDAKGHISPNSLRILETVEYSAEIINATPFNRFSDPVSFKPFKIFGTLTQGEKGPIIRANFPAVSIAYATETEAKLNGQLEALLTPGALTLSAQGRIENIMGKEVDAGSLRQIKRLTDPGFNWRISGTADTQTSGITVTEVSLKNTLIQVNSEGIFSSFFDPTSAKITASLSDLGTIAENIEGQVNTTLLLQRGTPEAPLKATVQVQSTKLSLSDPLLNELIGPAPSLTAEIYHMPAGNMTIPTLAFMSDHLVLKGIVAVSAEQLFENSSFHVDLSNLSELKSLNTMALEGTIAIDGAITGPVRDPSTALTAGFKKLELQQLALTDLLIEISANTLFTAPTGYVTAKSETNAGALSATTTFTSEPPGQYYLPNLDMKLGAYQAKGYVRAPKGKPVTGEILISTDIRAQHHGILGADIQFSDQDSQQKIAVKGTVQDFSTRLNSGDFLTLENTSVSAAAVFGERSPDITIDADITNLSHPDFQMRTAKITTQPAGDALAYSLKFLGTNFMPYDIALTGTTRRPQNGPRHISLNIAGTLDKTIIESAAAIEANIATNTLSIEPFKVRMGDGELSGSLVTDDAHMRTSLHANVADLRPLGLFFPDLPVTGLLTGNIDLNTNLTDIDGGFSLALSSISTGPEATLLDEGVTASISGEISRETLVFSGTTQLENSLNARFSGTVPLAVNSTVYKVFIPRDQPILAEMMWQGDLGPVWPVFNLINHDLIGLADTRFALAGTLNAPEINGHIRLSKGRYENMQTGFTASNINMDAQIKDRQITLDKLTATDGAEGTIVADGVVALEPDLSLTAQLDLILDHARIIRQPKLAVTASSKLSFVKTPTSMDLTGDINVNNANVGAVTQGSPSIIELDVHEINSETGQRILTNGHGNHIGPVNLNLNFNAPGRLFIQSYGLDSEWEATVAVQGPLQAPILTGTASLLRGSFEFSGKIFKLTRGLLSFPGDRSNDPALDITAEHTVSGLTAILNITGKASAPTLTMTSTPNLPQDEILSRIFFGTSVTELSAIEAVQLASTIHTLSTGGGPGVIGGMRRKLGIDRLSIGRSEENKFGPTITGGKYLTNNIYIEVTTAPATGETATAVEVSLTPNLSIVTRRALGNENNLAIKWSWDY